MSTIVLGQPAPAPPPLAIEHVTVLPMTVGSSELYDQTVTLQGGRIVGIEESAQATVGDEVRRIDGTGKYLIRSASQSGKEINL